jgi:hypothetical protein
MENKNQYYYPYVEDIRIGWEGEVNWNRGYEETYTPEIVKLRDETGAYLKELHELTIAIDDGYAEARTPFLTKEKIEAEGWEKENILIEEEDEDILAEGLSYHISEDRWFEMHFLPNNEICIIEKYYRNQVTQCWNKRFEGYCPTINEFRTLMRWFNIKKEDGKE